MRARQQSCNIRSSVDRDRFRRVDLRPQPTHPSGKLQHTKSSRIQLSQAPYHASRGRIRPLGDTSISILLVVHQGTPARRATSPTPSRPSQTEFHLTRVGLDDPQRELEEVECFGRDPELGLVARNGRHPGLADPLAPCYAVHEWRRRISG